MNNTPSNSGYPHFLTLIIPAYRKEKIIVKNIQSIKKVLDKIRYDYEIIVVIDGKIDSSFEKLKTAAIPKTTIIEYEKNHGRKSFR
jgi:glycosyltransferase involved in cell wall biosynthesis